VVFTTVGAGPGSRFRGRRVAARNPKHEYFPPVIGGFRGLAGPGRFPLRPIRAVPGALL